MTPGEAAVVLGEAITRCDDLTPALEEFATWMKSSVKENFVAQGRPQKWAPVQAHPGHRTILVDTGALVDSTTAFVDGKTDVVLAAGGGGQPAPKAPALQYGAQLHMRRSRSTGEFVTRRTRKNVSRGDVIGYGVLPARPYLLFQEEDLTYFAVLIPEYVFKVVG